MFRMSGMVSGRAKCGHYFKINTSNGLKEIETGNGNIFYRDKKFPRVLHLAPRQPQPPCVVLYLQCTVGKLVGHSKLKSQFFI